MRYLKRIACISTICSLPKILLFLDITISALSNHLLIDTRNQTQGYLKISWFDSMNHNPHLLARDRDQKLTQDKFSDSEIEEFSG